MPAGLCVCVQEDSEMGGKRVTDALVTEDGCWRHPAGRNGVLHSMDATALRIQKHKQELWEFKIECVKRS